MKDNKIKRLCCTHSSGLNIFSEKYLGGEVKIEYIPQGTFAECMRSGGAGIPAFWTTAGYGTQRQMGGQIIKYDNTGFPCIVSEGKETRCFNGPWYILEPSIHPDYAIVKAYKCDRAGNMVFRLSGRTFNGPAPPAARR